MTKYLKGYDDCMMIGMIPTDPIDLAHDVLLQKLYAIGSSKHSVNCFNSYLPKKSFLVNLGNNFSQSASAFCGVHKLLFWDRLAF